MADAYSSASPSAEATRIEVLSVPMGPYLERATLRFDRSPYMFTHRFRFPLLIGALVAFSAYEWARGQPVFALAVTSLHYNFGDVVVGLEIALVCAVMGLVSAYAAVLPWTTPVASVVHGMALSVGFSGVVATLDLQDARWGSAFMASVFWAMVVMKSHSFFAAHRLRAPPTPWAGVFRGTISLLRGSRPDDPDAARPWPFVVFLLQPSLVYRPFAPRLARIRIVPAVREAACCVLIIAVVHLVDVHFVYPSVAGSPLSPALLAQLMIPSNIFVPLVFYMMWHCGMSLGAELTLYADRTAFYSPWWRARTVADYFRSWSRPVSEWLREHVVVDVVRSYMRRKPRKDGARAPRGIYAAAALLAFVVSGLLHEVVLFMTVHKITVPWMTGGLAVVAALTSFERRFRTAPPVFVMRVAPYIGHAVMFALIGNSLVGS